MIIICFKHPNYVASDVPDLSCRTCCSMYVAEINEKRKKVVKAKKKRDMAWI
jgi:hypothetical protein